MGGKKKKCGVILKKYGTSHYLWLSVTTIFFILALFALPYSHDWFDRFTPESEATFRYSMHDETGSIVGDGYITFSCKGGLNANNPLQMDVTLYLNRTFWENYYPLKIIFRPHGTYDFPIMKDERGFPLFADIYLTNQGDDKWTGGRKVVYYQGDFWGANVVFDDRIEIIAPNFIRISSEDVTILVRTNAILLSLTLVTVAFACLNVAITCFNIHRKK